MPFGAVRAEPILSDHGRLGPRLELQRRGASATRAVDVERDWLVSHPRILGAGCVTVLSCVGVTLATDEYGRGKRSDGRHRGGGLRAARPRGARGIRLVRVVQPRLAPPCDHGSQSSNGFPHRKRLMKKCQAHVQMHHGIPAV